MMTLLLRRTPLLSLLLLVLHANVASAFPNAAGACPAGVAAVGGTHVTEGATTGGLMDGGFDVFLNGHRLGGAEPLSFQVGEYHSLAIGGINPFRGFLIRVGPPPGVANSVNLLQAIQRNGTDSQVATLSCVEVEQVGGLTHTTNNDKFNVSGVLLVDQFISGISLDITVVTENAGGVSSYFYSNFLLGAIAAPVAPSTPPMDDGEDAPMLQPAPTPTISPAPTGTETSEGPAGIDVDFIDEGTTDVLRATTSSARDIVGDTFSFTATLLSCMMPIIFFR